LERLLVLGAGPAQVGLLAAARARRLFVIAADRDARAPGFAFADRRAIVPADDEPMLERLAEAERVDGVIAAGPEAPVGAAARVAARLGLAHPLSPEAAVLSSSKLRQRERLDAARIPQTAWQVVSAPDEVVRVPCLVRPPDRPGSRARSLVRSSRELRAALKSALRASRLGLCLVEEVVESPVVTVTGFSRDGVFRALAATDRVDGSELWESEHATLAAGLAQAAVEALEIREGPTVTRVRLDPDGPKVLDLNACVGPGEAELCRAALGIDLYGLALAGALGEPVSARRLRPRRRAHAACVRFQPDGEAVLATAGTREEALLRANRAAECIRFPAADAQVV
jgi:carbamoylphosphate synthase large subunit